jgi:hypothetical protein
MSCQSELSTRGLGLAAGTCSCLWPAAALGCATSKPTVCMLSCLLATVTDDCCFAHLSFCLAGMWPSQVQAGHWAAAAAPAAAKQQQRQQQQPAQPHLASGRAWMSPSPPHLSSCGCLMAAAWWLP